MANEERGRGIGNEGEEENVPEEDWKTVISQGGE